MRLIFAHLTGAITTARLKAEAPGLPVRNFWPIEHADRTPCCRSTHHVGGGRPRACRWACIRVLGAIVACYIVLEGIQGHELAYLQVLSVSNVNIICGVLVSIFSIVTYITPFPAPKAVTSLYCCPYRYTSQLDKMLR